MSNELTAEDVEREYLKAMGAELGPLYHLLWSECALLHIRWNEYLILFGSNPKRLALLNAAAPFFFRMTQDAIWESVLLHICRLTDPLKSAGKSNLTLARLPLVVRSAIQPEIEQLLDNVQQKCAFARKWRHRHIAHRDLQLAVEKLAEPLPPATRASVDGALESITAVLNVIEREYRGGTVAYRMSILPLGNAEALLHVLRDGLEMRAAQERRLHSGQILPEDFVPRPPI